MTIQTNYNRHQSKGFVGTKARPNAPYNFEQGEAGVAVRPGQGVLFDIANQVYVLPTSAVEQLEVTHIVAYEMGTIQTGTAIPAGANSDVLVEFAAGDVLKLADEGHFFVTGGETLVPGDEVKYDHATDKWVKHANADLDGNPRKSVVVKVGGADEELIEVQLQAGTRRPKI